MKTTRTLIAATIALGISGAFTQANALSFSVKMACASDYYAYCSQHTPGSSGVRQCMRSHGSQLSSRCVNALINAGEVSRNYVEKRRAAAN